MRSCGVLCCFYGSFEEPLQCFLNGSFMVPHCPFMFCYVALMVIDGSFIVLLWYFVVIYGFLIVHFNGWFDVILWLCYAYSMVMLLLFRVALYFCGSSIVIYGAFMVLLLSCWRVFSTGFCYGPCMVLLNGFFIVL